MKCSYNDCNQTVTDQEDTSGLCPWHLDLEVLADFLKDSGKPVTLEGLCRLMALGISKGGSFVITPDDLTRLITPEFAQKYEMAEGVTV